MHSLKDKNWEQRKNNTGRVDDFGTSSQYESPHTTYDSAPSKIYGAAPLEERDHTTLRAYFWERREAPTYQRTRRRTYGERAVTARLDRFYLLLSSGSGFRVVSGSYFSRRTLP